MLAILRFAQMITFVISSTPDIHVAQQI